MLQVRGGVERDSKGRKAGKGALVQDNLAPCLGTALDTTLITKAHMEDNQIQAQYIVRRLTPKECERLMGYPDDYTIPMFKEITDELVDEFVRIHNEYNALTSDKPIKPKTHKQVRKWLEAISKKETCMDAPRYKVCGNGWAINCARWVLLGIEKYLYELDSMEN